MIWREAKTKMEAAGGTRRIKWMLLRILVYCAAGVVLLFAGLRASKSYRFQESGRTAAPPQHKTRVGEPLPDFDLTDIKGRRWRLADLKGKVTYVNVWATW